MKRFTKGDYDILTYPKGEGIFMTTTKIWQLKKWKDSVKNIKKENCECCGSNKQPLIQHHLKSYRQRWYELRIKLAEKFCQENNLTLYPSSVTPFHGGFNTKVKKGVYKRVQGVEFEKWLDANQGTVAELKAEGEKEYLSMKDTITLCKGCHFQVEFRHRSIKELKTYYEPKLLEEKALEGLRLLSIHPQSKDSGILEVTL